MGAYRMLLIGTLALASWGCGEKSPAERAEKALAQATKATTNAEKAINDMRKERDELLTSLEALNNKVAEKEVEFSQLHAEAVRFQGVIGSGLRAQIRDARSKLDDLKTKREQLNAEQHQVLDDADRTLRVLLIRVTDNMSVQEMVAVHSKICELEQHIEKISNSMVR